MAGNVCGADEAFDRVRREIARLDSATWTWFVERFLQIEQALTDAGGFDAGLADLIESPYGFMGLKETVDRHFETEAICVQLEELVAAFFVTLQPRLNAVKVATKRVYDVSVSIDGIRVTEPSATRWPRDLELAWHVANYVKHNDEWDVGLNARQQTTLNALLELGVAHVADGRRGFARWVLIETACALSDETTLARAVPTIVARCKASCDEIESAIQRDFGTVADAINTVRRNNVPRLHVRAHSGLPDNEDS